MRLPGSSTEAARQSTPRATSLNSQLAAVLSQSDDQVTPPGVEEVNVIVLFVYVLMLCSYYPLLPALLPQAITRNKPETTTMVIITRWPQVLHTTFSYSTYSRRHVIGCCQRSASLCLVR